MKILLPIDGSDTALEAVRQALRMVNEGLRASLVLANVQEPATLYEMLANRAPFQGNKHKVLIDVADGKFLPPSW